MVVETQSQIYYVCPRVYFLSLLYFYMIQRSRKDIIRTSRNLKALSTGSDKMRGPQTLLHIGMQLPFAGDRSACDTMPRLRHRGLRHARDLV